MKSGKALCKAALVMTALWSSVSSVAYAAGNDRDCKILTELIAQYYSGGYGDQSSDLLPPSIGGSGAKVQPTVTPSSAFPEPGYGGNGMANGRHYGYGPGGHHRGSHFGRRGYFRGMQGQGQNGLGYGPNGRNNRPGSSNAFGSSQPSGGGVVIWNAPSSNAARKASSNLPAQTTSSLSSSSSSSSKTTVSVFGGASATQAVSASATPPELQAAFEQTHELEQQYAHEASEQIQRIHAEASARKRQIGAQISANNQGNSYSGYGGRRKRNGGRRRNSYSNGANDYLQKQLSQESTYEQKRIESVQKEYQAKERAVEDAAQHLSSHYDPSGSSSVPRLGATRNDLHVQNYEINDNASGAEVPLMASPKSLRSLPAH